MTAREAILGRVRSALGRAPGQVPSDLPPVLFSPALASGDLLGLFLRQLAGLGVKAHLADEGSASRIVGELLGGRSAVASNSLHLAAIGVAGLPNVRCGIRDKVGLRELCANSEVGITSADYGLADTGSLVLLSTKEEARMISLLPPVHIAVIPKERILSGLDEFLQKVPLPAERSSSVLLITGTSKTGDIEQILVRGVHGPGEVHVVVT